MTLATEPSNKYFILHIQTLDCQVGQGRRCRGGRRGVRDSPNNRVRAGVSLQGALQGGVSECHCRGGQRVHEYSIPHRNECRRRSGLEYNGAQHIHVPLMHEMEGKRC